MYKPLVSILGDFYENRFLFIEALYVVNLPSVPGPKKNVKIGTKKNQTLEETFAQCYRMVNLRH